MIKKVLELNQKRTVQKNSHKRTRVLINFFAAVWCNNTKINMRIVYFYLQYLKGFSNLIERVLYGFFLYKLVLERKMIEEQILC